MMAVSTGAKAGPDNWSPLRCPRLWNGHASGGLARSCPEFTNLSRVDTVREKLENT